MPPTLRPKLALTAAVVATLLLPTVVQAGRPRSVHERIGHLTFTSPQSSPIALSPDGGFLYAVNTANNSVSVIDTTSLTVVAAIAVGERPFGVTASPQPPTMAPSEIGELNNRW